MSSPPQNSGPAASASRRWLLLVFGVLLPLFCFGWLADAVWNRNGLTCDVPILTLIHQFATPARDVLMVWVTRMGGVKVVLLFTGVASFELMRRQKRRETLFICISVGGALLLDWFIKNAIHRVRPHLWVSPAPEFDFSFPSGHSTGTMALAIGLAVIAWRARWRWRVVLCGCIYVAAVGFSRLYLGVHYPSDVLGGWALSIMWVCALALLVNGAQTNAISPKKIGWLAATCLASFAVCLGGYISSDLQHNNLRVIVPAEAYRAGKMSTNAMARCIETYGIKSVLNLRGESWDREWYRGEMETAEKLNVAHYDFGISARQELTDAEMMKLEQMLRAAPKPVLIHCDGGADRSALASAIYLYAVAGKTSEEAGRELSPWNGHLPVLWPKVIAMDNSFWRYVSNHVTHPNTANLPGN